LKIEHRTSRCDIARARQHRSLCASHLKATVGILPSFGRIVGNTEVSVCDLECRDVGLLQTGWASGLPTVSRSFANVMLEHLIRDQGAEVQILSPDQIFQKDTSLFKITEI
jgi:hypothetical protein